MPHLKEESTTEKTSKKNERDAISKAQVSRNQGGKFPPEEVSEDRSRKSERNISEGRLSRGPRPSRQQRSLEPAKQPQVSSPWAKPSLNPNTKCLALTQKHGFPFSEEELNYWQRCPQIASSANKSRQVSQEVLHFTAREFQSKRLRQPQDQAFMATESPGIAPLNGQGMASQTAQGRASLHLSIVCPVLENRWQSYFSHTDVQENRPWWHQDGFTKKKAGKECHGMDPSWVISTSSGKKTLQKGKHHLPGASSSPEAQGPFYDRLRQRMPWWQRHTKSPQVMGLIQHGVQASYPLPSKLSRVPCKRSQEETKLAWETIQEYLEVGAIQEINLQDAKHLIPWFVIQKGEKLRLITNCKEIN